MRRKIILLIIGMFVVVAMVSVALAINLGSFKPAKDSRITNLWNATYERTANGDKNADIATGPNSKPTIMPKQTEWRYGIIPTAYRDQKTVVGKGILSFTLYDKLS